MMPLPIMNFERVTVLAQHALGGGYHVLSLSCHPSYSEARPGQFVMLRAAGQMTPLLSRPFSIHDLIRENGAVRGIKILYRVVGDGTRRLAATAAEAPMELLGPLGRGYARTAGQRRIFLAAGGVGAAPMLFLARDLLADPDGGLSVEAFIGGRSRQDLVCGDDLEALGIAVHRTTDDGSHGRQCLVTDPLAEAVAANPPDVIFACGPPAMLQCVAGVARGHGVACQVSVETLMACGIGACLGCAVPPADPEAPYWHSCVDGPVFDVTAIDLDALVG